MAEVEKARQVLQAERQTVLDELQRVGRDHAAEFDRHESAVDAIEVRAHDLLLRGKGAGVPVKEMAAALDMSRQRAHMMIRNAEQEKGKGKPDA